MAEMLGSTGTYLMIFSNHVDEDTPTYPEGFKAKSKGHWYAMQVEASNNFEVPRRLADLCGGLDTHIEHHLFPTLPPNRLRQIAPDVRRICEEHGVSYRSRPLPSRLKRVFRRLGQLSRSTKKS